MGEVRPGTTEGKLNLTRSRQLRRLYLDPKNLCACLAWNDAERAWFAQRLMPGLVVLCQHLPPAGYVFSVSCPNVHRDPPAADDSA